MNNQPKYFTSTSMLPDRLKGGVVAIGNFDGVHLGHRAVLDTALDIASKNNIPSLVLTFEPHPRTWFAPKSPVFRLTPAPIKTERLHELGFDGVVCENFNSDFASLSAKEFILQHLVKGFNTSHVVIGFNFHFGKNRKGTPELLRLEGLKHGFELVEVKRFVDQGGDRVSSSRIRIALQDGDIKTANSLLGYDWKVSGTVVEGAQLGRTLGFPTANIKLPEEMDLMHGIYAVRLIRQDGTKHNGVASFGRRPTFDNGAPLLETFVFDFSGDLYDEEIHIEFVKWIRAEEKFENSDALVMQMNKDADKAKSILKIVNS